VSMAAAISRPAPTFTLFKSCPVVYLMGLNINLHVYRVCLVVFISFITHFII
jgi:hypothetical protein